VLPFASSISGIELIDAGDWGLPAEMVTAASGFDVCLAKSIAVGHNALEVFNSDTLAYSYH